MKRVFLWVSLVLASIVVIGIVIQLYLIAAWIFGAGKGALDAHKAVGGAVVHPAEILVFLVSFGAWSKDWRNIGISFSLALLGTIQVFLAGNVTNPSNGYLHGLHGGLALFVAALAVYICWREKNALGFRRSPAPATPV